MEEKKLRVGGERYRFKLDWELESYADVPYTFSDELTKYTFVPYACSLRDVPGYEENRDLFEECRIYIMVAEPKRLLKVPCRIREDNCCVYLTDGTFNKYWKYISERILRRLKEECAGEAELTMKEVNSLVDLSQVENANRSASISRNGTLVYQGQDVDLEIQRMISKKAAALEDNRILYVYSTKNNYVHDKTCKEVEKIHYQQFRAVSEFPKDRRLCSYCKKQLHVRTMIAEDNKHFPWCYRMMEEGKVYFSVIEELATTYKVKLRMSSPDIMVVKCGEDTWQIEKVGQEQYKLYHNNYVMVSKTERYITDGYHEQKNHPTTLYGILRFVAKYEWTKHLDSKYGVINTVEKTPVQAVVHEASKKKPSFAAMLWSKLKDFIRGWRK